MKMPPKPPPPPPPPARSAALAGASGVDPTVRRLAHIGLDALLSGTAMLASESRVLRGDTATHRGRRGGHRHPRRSRSRRGVAPPPQPSGRGGERREGVTASRPAEAALTAPPSVSQPSGRDNERGAWHAAAATGDGGVYRALRDGGGGTREQAQLLERVCSEAGFEASRLGAPEPIREADAPLCIYVPLLGMTPAARPILRGRDEVTIRVFHGTSEAGLAGILASGGIKAQSWDDGGAGAHGFYCQAFVQWTPGSEWDADETVRILRRLRFHSKNQCGVIVGATAKGLHRTLNSGGIVAEAAIVTPTVFTHHRREGRWCVHPSSAQVHGLYIFF